MKRKKRGNSLIVVVTTCMFVTTISAATLTMVSGNYKARVVESKRVENLYSSDSGIDVAYNIVGKTFDAATQYANLKVQQMQSLTKDSIDDGTSGYNGDYIKLKQDIYKWQTINNNKSGTDITPQNVIDENIKSDNKKCEDIIDEEFKRTFMNFILPWQEAGDPVDPKKGVKESVPTKSLRDYIKNSQYVDKVKGITNKDGDYDIATVQYPANSNPKLWIPEIGIPNPENPVKSNGMCDEKVDGLSIDSNKLIYTIIVKSNFKTSAGNTSVVGENSRIIQATYTMSVPSYEDIFSKQESGDLHDYLAFNDDRALTIHGDMNVNNANDFNVTGNIFVEGNDPTISQNENPSLVNTDNRTFEKYYGGITIANSDNVTFNNDVITRNTFNIQDYANTTIIGNLYGRNVYVGNKDNSVANNADLTAKNAVVLDNDLALKAKSNSTIEINDFYGINDKNVNYDDLKGNTVTGDSSVDKVKNSSSIIVNSIDDSSRINIDNSAYIMGTAHIDTRENGSNNGYQTGESGAVKGNYIAYSVPLNDAEQFDYYNPMQLLKDTNVFNKATHFAGYWDGKNPDTGGIHLPADATKVHSVGAIVYEDPNGFKRVFKSNYQLNDDNIINSKRVEFAGKVYKFGLSASLNDYNATPTGFDSLMTLSQTIIDNAGYKLDDQINSSGEKGIFNYSPDITLIVQGNDISNDKKYYDDQGNEITNKKIIKGDSDNILSAVIATTGNVIIDGNVNYYGSIIAKGNLNVTGNGVINYSKDVIDIVQQQNHDLFFNVFGQSMLDDSSQIITQTYNSDSQAVSYDLKNFLESKLWKIVR